MVLVQIYLDTTNNNTYQTVPVFGKCSVRVLGVQYHSNNGAAVTLQLRSDQLIFQYSPTRYLTFVAYGSGMNFDNSHVEYHINNIVFNGRIHFNLIDMDTGVQPVHMHTAVITLDIEKIGQDVSV